MTRATVLGFLVLSGVVALAQTAPPPDQDVPPQQQQLLPPDQLDNLVAPVALYPDSVLSGVLAASTYPLEIVEAQQWFDQNRNLQGPQRVDAARQQNWDPSVQALVAFPDVLALLNRDIRWTTDLGNAFLNQEADVMAAVQRMRARAQNNGRLQNTPQQRITTETQDGQSAIGIQPVDPQVVYVPTYDPEYVWGPPAWGAYPPLFYPSFGFGFGPACYLGSLFTGFLGFGGWGWGLNWFAHGLFFNGLFFNHFGYHGFGGGFGGGYGGFYGRNAVWAHNPAHRLGVAYPNRAVAGRYGGGAMNGGWRSFNNNRGNTSAGFQRGSQPGNRMAEGGNRAGGQAYRGYSNSYRGQAQPSARATAPRTPAQNFSRTNSGQNFAARNNYSARSYSPAQQHYAAPQHYSAQSAAPHYSPAPHYSAPRSSGGHVSAPHGSSYHSSGGSHFSGGHSGGGHSGGGGHKR